MLFRSCNETLDFPVESDQEFITQAFMWEDTEEGKEYWRGIALKASSYRYKRRKMFSEILKELSDVS